MVAFAMPLPGRKWRRRTTLSRHVCCAKPYAPSPISMHSAQESTPPIVFVLGGPGSGKGTQCSLLKQDYDLEQICVGDLLRREAARGTILGNTVSEIMKRGDIVPGEVTMALLKEELAGLVGRCSGVLIDGFPRAMDQAKDFERAVAACEFVLYFQCDSVVMVDRLLRRGKTSGRADDVKEVVRKRLKTFAEITLPVVEYYRDRGLLREVDSGCGSPEDVYRRAKALFEESFAPYAA